MPHRRATVRAGPRVLHVRHVGHDLLHLRPGVNFTNQLGP
jgi:hypothetical protein